MYIVRCLSAEVYKCTQRHAGDNFTLILDDELSSLLKTML